MTENGDVRSSQLARRVEEIEKLIRSGVNVAGTSLASLLETAQARLDSERSENEHISIEKKEREQQERVAIAHLVEREHRLNAAEKEQYGRFLDQDYFTKANFDALDRFYAKSWDKLSDEGKAQMSHRVWEGIRRDEYKFDELSETVRKKEAERLYQQLGGEIQADESLKNIPKQDKQDFIREYKAGSEKGVSDVLKREVFSENVSSRTVSAKESGSVSKENRSEDQQPKKDPKVRQDEEAEVSGVIFAETKSVPPTQLPQSRSSKATEKG